MRRKLSSSSIEKQPKLTPSDPIISEASHPAESAVTQSVFSGGGETGELMRVFDWSATPVGPPATWPQSLKTVVRVLLTSRFAMWMGWGPELTFFYNDAYARMTLGKKHPWAIGKPSREVWAEIWGDIGPRIQKVLATGEATWDEALLLFLERSGYREETYHTFSYSPLAGDDGRVAGHLCVVSEDTERVIGERRLATLRTLAAELSTASTEHDVMAAVERTLQQNGKDLPFTLTYLFTSEGHPKLGCKTGIDSDHPAAPTVMPVTESRAWPAGEVLERNAPLKVDDLDSWFGQLPAGAWEESPKSALLVPIASQGQERPAGIFIAALNPYRQGDANYGAFIELIAGQIAGSLANARAYEQERRRAESLAELDRAKTTFFSNVSHEFRTPLTLMLGPLEEVLSKSEDSVLVDNRQLVEVAHRNGTRLLKLVNTLLDFSRIEAGRMKAVYQPTDLAGFTRELASLFQSATDRAGLELQVHCEALSRPVYVDRDMWEKVVLNLLSNAFKFTFNGGIFIELHEDVDFVELTVRDTGSGIPEAELPRVFERFHRVEGTRGRSFEGSGIGLALVQELVKLHGGAISVDSKVGRGTTFRLKVPFGAQHLPKDHVIETDIAPAPRAGTSPYVAEALSWLGTESRIDAAVLSSHDAVQVATPADAVTAPTVLLVDDNRDMREYVDRLLRGHFNVVKADNAKTAVEMLMKDPPDVVLTDVMMPGMDGLQLLAAIRGNPTTETIPVMLLSARAGDESRIEGMQHGADDYVVKPFSGKELLARVQTHLQLSRLRKQAVETVRASEHRLRQIIDALPAAVYTTDAEGRLTHFNRAAVEFSGRQPELGTDRWCVSWKLFRADGSPLPHDECPMAVTLKENRPVRGVEAIAERPNGERIWFQPYPTPLRDADGNVIGGINMLVDITERKRYEDILRANEERVRGDLKAMRLLQEVGMQCSRAGNDLAGCLQKILKVAIAITEADKGNLQLWERGSGGLKIAAQQGFDQPFLDFFATVQEDEGACCGRALREGGRIVAEDVTQSEIFAGQDSLNVLLAAGVRAVQSTPLVSTSGTVLGMISTHFSHPHRPSERELRLIDLLARQAADYIEHKQAEEALRQSEDRFRAIIETTPECVKLVAADGTLLQMNAVGLEMVGADCAEMVVGKNVYDVIAPEDRERFREFNERICRGERGSLEFDIIGLKGVRRHMETHAAPLRNADGSLVQLAVTRDISERKAAERSLRESEQKLRVVTDATPVMIWLSGTDKLCYYFNKSWLDFVGRTMEQEIGNGWAEGVHPDDFDRCLQIYVTSFDARQPFEMEYRIRHHSGQYRWILDNGVPRFTADGTFEGYVGGCLDIHDQKEAMLTAQKLAAIVESSDDAIVSKDLNGIVTSWNPAAERIFGYTAEEMIGRSILTIIPPELHHDEEYILGTIGCGERIEHFETVRLTKTGERIDVSLTISPVKDETGRIVGAAKIARDITQQKKTEDALRTTERLAAVGRLAATVAHEINNPLAAVTNLVYLSKEHAVRDDVRQFLAGAEQELRRISHLTKQTLGFYREPTRPTAITLGSVVESTISVFASKARNKGVALVPEIKSDPEIYGFPSELHQLLGNLVNNSIDATECGGRIRIRVSAVNHGVNLGNSVRVTVADSGLGIPNDVRRRVYEPFFTTKKDVGTGLGLWICKTIVDRHLGSIRIWSSTVPGRSGTIVSVLLPVGDQESATDSLRQAV